MSLQELIVLSKKSNELEYKIEKLQEQNKKLRECVKFYAVNGLSSAAVGKRLDLKLAQEFYINGGYARQVLKEIGE